MLEIDKIDVYYGDLQALWGVSLSIRGGEIVALVGSNGAGKTTLLKTISGLLRPTKGSITFKGIRLDQTPPHKIVGVGISIVHEGRRLFPEMTVLENLEMGAYHSKANKVKKQTIEWVFETFPRLKERKNQISGTLSGGEQQMIAIGRALMAEPEFLLLDEVSLGLSPLIVEHIYGIIKDINKSKKMTIFLIEQNLRLALEVAERGFIIETGHIVRQDAAQVLLSSQDIKEAYLGFGPGGREI